MGLNDRASLLRRRQQIRQSSPQENRSSKSNEQQSQGQQLSSAASKTSTGTEKSTRTKSLDGDADPVLSHTKDEKKASLANEKRNKGSSSGKVAAAVAAGPNVALLIRQVLQRPHYGNLREYLKTATKEQLFEQTLLIAKFAVEVKAFEQATCERLEGEIALQQTKYNSIASDLLQSENAVHELETEKSELLHRLALADDEYKSLLTWGKQVTAVSIDPDNE